MRFVSSLILAFTVALNGQLGPALAFTGRHPVFLVHAGLLALASAGGQWFIFTTIRAHGPLVFATIMVVRQCLNVVLSTWLFSHSYNGLTLFGFVVVFATLGAKVALKLRDKRIQVAAKLAK